MLGRRTVLAVILAAAAAFGGGAAVAATHDGSAHTQKPAKLRSMKHPAVTNVHLPCHNHGAISRSL